VTGRSEPGAIVAESVGATTCNWDADRRGADAAFTAVAGRAASADVLAGQAGAGMVADAGFGLVDGSHLILLGFGTGAFSLALKRGTVLERKS
jgi:hypothetical protein